MSKRTWIGSLAALSVAAGLVACYAQQGGGGKKKVLFYSQSFGYRHSCVTRPLNGDLSHAEKVFREHARKAGYEVYLSQDFNDLRSPGDFKRFDAIVFFTTQSPSINKEALYKWLKDGGAIVGVHCASDSFYDWPEWGKAIGGYFKTHGPADREVVIKVEDQNHPATDHLGSEWKIADEIYQFREGSFSKDAVHVLLSIDNQKTDLAVQKMEADKYYPVSWTNQVEKGRIFYTSLGHREQVWDDPKYQEHLLGGLAWALGQKGSNAEASAR